MPIIGITGPTGAGKTSLLRQVEKLDGAVIDCDAVYHELLNTDEDLQAALENQFGPLRDENGCIDRKSWEALFLAIQNNFKSSTALPGPLSLPISRHWFRNIRRMGKN